MAIMASSHEKTRLATGWVRAIVASVGHRTEEAMKYRELEQQLRQMEEAQKVIQRQLDELRQMTTTTRKMIDGEKDQSEG